MSFQGIVGKSGGDIVSISSQRNIGGIVMQVTIEEEGIDENEITEHPVEQGAAISDHMYAQPAKLRIRAGSSNADAQGGNPQYVQQLYQQLLTLKGTFNLFTIVTGKRTYINMQFRSLTINTTSETETTLMMTAQFQQIITVETQTTGFDPNILANQAANGSPAQSGNQQSVYDPAFTPPTWLQGQSIGIGG